MFSCTKIEKNWKMKKKTEKSPVSLPDYFHVDNDFSRLGFALDKK